MSSYVVCLLTALVPPYYSMSTFISRVMLFLADLATFISRVMLFLADLATCLLGLVAGFQQHDDKVNVARVAARYCIVLDGRAGVNGVRFLR